MSGEDVFPNEAVAEMQGVLRGRSSLTRAQRIRTSQMLGEIPFLRQDNVAWRSVAARHALAAKQRDQIVSALAAALAEIGEPRP